ncbi:hypothetical protein [Parasedimentitalea psychrophila]|uniref:Uncharacterized protein n=1 Tax=Parasedimentitalea psychrophila TaxID=2997337 RepID=A0A9Y2L393_9RHOB|nr:hypothetical protein [Parasedimentitalea psychrophila]WIY26587.1 hypothetical protein QPJ95_06630 [Parasedimentitalea psychrophila]
MAYVTLTLWSVGEMSDEMLAIAKEKYVPMIMSIGATGVQMVRTGDLTMCVITQYSDSDAAAAAQEKIAKLRSQASSEFTMTMEGVHAGDVIAAS